ncbi:RTA1 like protein-domain-containing protein [Mycena maculata]|uniref:RTA1 like protein-domain-containing protein n=1 Tax=Mycena maculata TaxID=230809 RepID=A0AAD7ICM4_9AGAR|nr:RTA1 like protein-domain-containing protein [Mycena maculata]
MGLNLKQNPYGYTPTESVCILFVTLFGISSVVHLAQAIRYRLWWLFPTAILAGALRVLGWSARLWYSLSVLQPHAFEIQYPTPLAAANFMILGRIITLLGPALISLEQDILSLLVQGIGGGIAAHEVTTLKSPKTGSHVMLVGIISQLVTIAVYTLCAAEFLVRYLKRHPFAKRGVQPAAPGVPLTPRLKYLVIGMFLFIRAVYRVIELPDGFKGRLNQTQVYFNVLDGAMITLAIFTLDFAHPGFLLYGRTKKTEEIEDSEKR